MNSPGRRHAVRSIVALALSGSAFVQAGESRFRIGLLWISDGSDQVYLDALRNGLKQLGLVDGQGVAIDRGHLVNRYDELSAAARKLVDSTPDVIVTFGATAAKAVSAATRRIPTVIVIGSDPSQIGLVGSLAHPGGNMTGITLVAQELAIKRLEVLRDLVPRVRSIGAVFSSDGAADSVMISRQVEAGRSLGLKVTALEVRRPDEIDSIAAIARKARVDAISVVSGSMFLANRQRVVNAISKARLPAIYASSAYVEAGGFASYGPNLRAAFERAATFVDRIRKGAKPGDIPVEMPNRVEFVINQMAARGIGLNIPKALLSRADRVID